MSEWKGIESAPTDGTEVDLFGYIAYDKIEMRLTDCEFINGEWHYFSDGKMIPCASEISFTPTHWMPIPEDPE